MPKYIDYPNRQEWLKARINSLGASDVASVMWQGFHNAVEIWEEKVGLNPHKEETNKSRIDYGANAEEHIRALFALKNKDIYRIEYSPYRVYHSEKYPYLTATLDGEIERICDKKRGVWECKTVFIMSKRELEDWNGRIPDKYYIQVCDQLGVMNYDFAVVTAELRFPDGNCEIRNYTIERNSQVDNDIQLVTEEGVKFWTEYVIPKKKPSIKMTL